MQDRRQFLLGSLSTLGALTVPCRAQFGRENETGINLVPAAPANSPSYWCTWSAQNYMYGRGTKEFDVRLLEGATGNRIAHDEINEELLLGPDGWSKKFFPAVREDLYLLIDDGWEEGGPATFLLDEKKFPSFTGSPQERLRKLNEAIRAQGWRGLALWCRDTSGGDADDRLVQWSEEAGVHYWKVDIGDSSFHLNQVRDRREAPLTIEHVHAEGPLNGDWQRDGRFGEQVWGSPRIEILRQTDIYRTYDTTAILSIPTTLDRVSMLLLGAQGHPEVRGILNAEDEAYIAAVLGCTMGIMRHPLHGERPEGDPDLAFPGPRQQKRCMDEVVRALRWQRLAAPFPAGNGFIRLSKEILTDDWLFRPGETWFTESIGQHVRQGAPACISRNMDLPRVKCTGESPFVFTARFPNGAAALGTHERTSANLGFFRPKADVHWYLGNSPGPFGLFGYFESVTLKFDQRVPKTRILAQDLAADRALDITRFVRIVGPEIFLPGQLLSHVGLSHATVGDLSAPASVVKLEAL